MDIDEFLKQSAPRNVNGVTPIVKPRSISSIDDFISAAKPPVGYVQPKAPIQQETATVNKPTARRTFTDKIDSVTARPDYESKPASENWKKNFVRELPSSIAENLPFGVGEIIKQSRDEPNVVASVNFEDVLHGIVDVSKGTFKGLIGTGASLAGVPLKFNVPGLGEVTNLEYNAAQRVAQGESVGKVILEEGVVNNIFGVLMLAGLAGEVTGPRPTTIKKVEVPIENLPKGKGYVAKNQPKSFRLYEEPVQSQPLTPDMVNKLGVDLGPKYNPELPTYFKKTGTAKGTTKFEVVQVKPSHIETFLKKFGADVGKAPENMVTPLITKSIDTKQLTGTKIDIVPESTPTVMSKPDIVNKVEQIIPSIKESSTPDEHLIETAKSLAKESGDPEIVAKVEKAIKLGEENIKKIDEHNKSLEQYAEQAQQTPEKDLTQPISEPYRPARAIPAQRVYSSSGKFITGEFEGKPYTTDSYILEFNSNVQPPSKIIIVDGKKVTTPKVEVYGKDKAPTEEGIRKIIPDQTEAVKIEPVKLQSTEDGKQNFVTLEGDGVAVDMQQKYYDYFKKKYPNAVFMAVEAKRPVVVNSNGEMVGLIMPSDLKNSSFKLAPTWQKAKPIQPKLKDTKPETKITTEKKVEKKEEPKEKKLEPTRTPSTGSSGNLASKGAGKIGNFEPIEPLKEGTKPFKLHTEILAMGKKYNPNGSILESKNMPHGAAGVRWGDTGNISTQGLNDLAIMSHELSHTIDIENGITDKLMKVTGQASNGNPIYDPETRALRQGLTKVYTTFYAGAKDTHALKTRMREGYATLAQKYVEMPQTITKQFPGLVQEFLLPGGKFYNPTLAAMIADSHKISADYHNLSAIDKMGARVTDTLTETGKKSFLNPIEQVNYEMTDNIAPYEKLDQKLADTTRAYGYTINLIQQNIKGSFQYGTIKGHDNAYWGIRNGEPVKLQDFNWKTIVDSVGKENQLKFGYWLLGRATYFDYKELDTLGVKMLGLKREISQMQAQGEAIHPDLVKELGKTVDDHKQLKSVIEKDGITRQEATEAYNEGKEIFAEPARMFDILNKEKINQLRDVGLMTKEQASEYLSKEGYASRKRDIYNEIFGDSDVPGFIRVGSTKLSFTIRRTGSSKAVINPLVSSIHDDIEATKKAAKQMIVNQIGQLGLEATYPDLIQRVTLKTQVDKETGRISYPQDKQENVMMARGKNGERIPFEVDSIVARVFNEVVTPNNIGAIGRFMQFFGRTFTKGTTGILSTFVFKNPVIDTVSALAQTQTNYIPVYDQIKQLQKIVSNKDSVEAQYAREYMVFVGSSHTAMGIYDLTPEQQLQWIKGEVTGLEMLGNKLEGVVDILTIPTKMTEIGTRMMEYIKARKAGKPFTRALEMAGQISAPFHHKPRLGGYSGMQLWIGNLPYARSAIQVTTQAIKTMARDPKSRQRYLLVWGLVIAAYVAAQEGLMDDATEEQKALYEGLYGKQLARGIYFPDRDGKTLNVIPVSETMGWLGAMINMELMEMAGRTDYKIGDYAQAGTSFIPQQVNPFNGLGPWFSSIIPKPFDVGVGLMTNTKTYPAVLPIESQSLQRLPAGMRFNEKTSPVGKWMGEKFNMSPVKVDYVTTGLLGRAGNMVLGKESYWNFLSSFQQENYFTSSRLVQDFWEKRKEINEKYTGMKKDKDKYTPQEEAEIRKQHNKLENVYEKLNEFSDLDIEKYPDKAEKQRQSILKEIEKLDI